MRVAIIPTGRMEWEALAPALGRLFPGHEFYSLPTEIELRTQIGIDFPIPSFTSCDVTRLQGRSNNADKLVQRAAAEALGDRRRDAADLVVIVDDLEVHNRQQPGAVIAVMREAAQRHIEALAHSSRAQSRHTTALRTKVSFHVLVPMIESWLFADSQALATAGVPDVRRVRLAPSIDLEQFETADAGFDADTGATCVCWQALSGPFRRKCRPQWLKADPFRRFHPKAYISWLCAAPDEKNCSVYTETGGGAAALRELAWSALLANPEHALFARALVNDVADALGCDEPFPGAVAAETSRTVLPRDPVLRNM